MKATRVLSWMGVTVLAGGLLAGCTTEVTPEELPGPGKKVGGAGGKADGGTGGTEEGGAGGTTGGAGGTTGGAGGTTGGAGGTTGGAGGTGGTTLETCSATEKCSGKAECVELPGGSSFCMDSCDPKAPECGANQCAALSENDAYCFQKGAAEDAPCIENGKLCGDGSETAASCSYLEWDANDEPMTFRCKTECAAAEIGTKGSCGDGLTCLANPMGSVNVESDGAGGRKLCTDGGSECSAGFECMDLRDAKGNAFKACGAKIAWCGTQVALCGVGTKLGLEKELGACWQDPAAECGADGMHSYCGITGRSEGVGASVDDAYTMCVPGSSFNAPTYPSICLGICNLGEGDLNCGAGYECAVPKQPLYSERQLDAKGQQIVCKADGDDAPCDKAAGFKCEQLEQNKFFCARPYKMCQAVGG